ncbi:PREDICTED: LOW QUALITY PROTEIN: gamma-crystallin B-like [Buceros rhinoceros silvestris]|uniref:LOW QUALITY PROTEIN: gamma-crystallin B-like n=1 Tax=Buceros rhinoceros silvestris TaxID=175836 RepID=UPI000528402C|nr:PREDICTED: LOW QUALITY PROTEIN: gamma-crystallin B-like [Buceros rhinoceros silvestris]
MSHLDLQPHVKQCNSTWVEKGSWMSYTSPNYSGHQYFLKRRDYPDFQKCFFLCNFIRSCHVILQMSSYPFTGTPELLHVGPGYIQLPDISSLSVLDGSWILYEMPSFRG